MPSSRTAYFVIARASWLRLAMQFLANCVFRSHLTADSGATWAPIPV
jgi:hypothetical protein